ncbi:cupin domain-containing protein [Roseobacter sp. EG26]|uniref:cupin domain-containing protein n=1 Tax=Roseobacter sp. EG26 TaxID=3412477 RepID=UPI003CE5537C
MPTIIRTPTRLRAAGGVEKSIFEYLGRMGGEDGMSVARMESPAGWSEPGQRPAFREVTLVVSGALRVETERAVEVLRAGEAIIAEPGDWVRYSTPDEPAEYLAVCTPAFTPERVNRDYDHGETSTPARPA